MIEEAARFQFSLSVTKDLIFKNRYQDLTHAQLDSTS